MGIEMTDLEDAKGIAGVASKPQFSGECRRVKLNEICSKGKSSLRQKDVFNDGPYSVYGASGVVGTTGDYQNEIPYVAVVKDGAGVGRASACEARTSVLGTMQALIPNSNVERDYLLHLVRSLRLGEGFSGSTIPHIYFKDYGKLEVPLPPLETQKEIVSRLGLIEVQIEQAEAQAMRLDNLVKSRFNKMFGDYESWLRSSDKKRLDELCWIGSSKRVHKNDYVSDGIPFFRSKEIVELSKGERPTTELYIERDQFERITEKNGAPAAGDLLVTAVGTIGVIWIVDGCSPFYFKDGNLLWLKPNNLEPTFLKYLLSELLSKDVDRLTGGSAYRALTIDRISQMMVVVPSPALQSEFAFFVHQVDKLRFDVQQQIDKLELLKNSLMQEYFG